MQSVEKHSALLSIVALCAALGVARASFYRHQRRLESPPPSRRRPGPPRALNQGAREEVLALLRSPRFVDRSPAEMQHTLVEEDGRYLCSESTMYRILRENAEVRDRRNQLRHPSYAKPELLATAQNQVWSWDITKLKGPSKWVYYYLFVMLDIFSRYVVAWMVAEHENAELAKRLIRDAYDKQGVEPGTLIMHNDRGSPMKAKTTGQLVASLGVEQSFSRPHVSNDNPFSESHFKTCKYHPGFPERFGSITDALQYCRTFFPWYNDEHRHSSLVYLTPKQVHYGSAQAALDKRHEVMLAAYREHPQRFVNGPPKPAALPTEVWINPPTAPEKQDADAGVPVTPTGADAATGVETASDGSSPQAINPWGFGGRSPPIQRPAKPVLARCHRPTRPRHHRTVINFHAYRALRLLPSRALSSLQVPSRVAAHPSFGKAKRNPLEVPSRVQKLIDTKRSAPVSQNH
jgi:putative transposase